VGEAGLGRLFEGSIFAPAQAAFDFREEIAANVFGDDAGRAEFAKVRDGEFRKNGKNGGERGGGLANEGEAHVVSLRPLFVLGDGFDDAGRELGTRERLEDVGFAEICVVEDDGEDWRVAFGEESAGDTAGAAASERDFLAERKLREAGDELFFGVAFEFGESAGSESELDEIHEIEIAKEAKADEARSVGMEDKRFFYGVIFQELFARGNFFNKSGRKIFSREEDEGLLFVEGGILGEIFEGVRGTVADFRGEFFLPRVAGGIVSCVGHRPRARFAAISTRGVCKC